MCTGTERCICTKHMKDNLDHSVATELNVGVSFNIGSDDEKAMTNALDMYFQEPKDVFVPNI